jgi:DNA-binding transcriptional regulator YdaS (Cro superfamily)
MCKDAMLRAIKSAVEKHGSLARVAERLRVTRQAIEQWNTAKGKFRVPPKHVLALEAMSGVSRHELRPDIYGPPRKRVRPKRRAFARFAAEAA